MQNVKNEWLLNTAGRWFNSVLKTAISNAVASTLKSLMADGFKMFSKLLAAQQALMKKVGPPSGSVRHKDSVGS